MTEPDRGVRVALVDDTPDFRLLLRMALESFEGYSVVAEADNGAEGIEVVRRHQPDVALLDLAMPVMDGLEALPLMRLAAPGTRFVVLSGFEDARMREAALSAGAVAYLQKGASAELIGALIAQIMGGPAPATRRSAAAQERAGEEQTELERLSAALATAAHELRSPATILVGLATTIKRRRGTLDNETLDQLLDAVVRQSRVLDRVTADLLTSSQCHRGVVSIDVHPMPLGQALRAVAIAVAERDHLHVECPEDLWVVADRVRVEQMLTNLISNAMKYGNPPVRICARRCTGRAEVRVLDAGPGVPDELVPRLFQQYARASGLRASGTGLGLYVVRSLAQAQGGDAWYKPLPGADAGFGFRLPLTVPQDGDVGAAA